MIGIAAFVNVVLFNFVNLHSTDLEDCKLTVKGLGYLGSKSSTEFNMTCQYWSSAMMLEPVVDEAFPDGSKTSAKNYCRNPNSEPGGPWCYTTDKVLIIDSCKIPLCKIPECRITGTGMEYTGLIKTSVSGKKCLKWKDFLKSKRNFLKSRFFPDGSIDQAENKCRNPDESIGGPWCYVQNSYSNLTIKELCDVPFCDDIGNLMYTEESSSGNYFFFSSINKSYSLNISFWLWNPDDWLQGKIYLFLSAYDIALKREEIDRWHSGVELQFTNNGSKISVKNGCNRQETKIPQIVSGAKRTNLKISWFYTQNNSYLIQVSQYPSNKPVVSGEILITKTVFEVTSFRYFSVGGSPALWHVFSEDCPVHTVTGMNFTRFWLIKKELTEKHIEIFVRAQDITIVMRTAPMITRGEVLITIENKEKVKILTNINNKNFQEIAQTSCSNILDLWKYEYLKIILIKNKLKLLWVKETATHLLIEATHPNLEKAMWVTFGSPWPSYWTIYCDPRGSSDFPSASPPECISENSEPYKGTLSVTKTRQQCLPWTDIDFLPVKYQNDDLFKPYGGKVACQNFCRNLDKDPKGPYCVVREQNAESGFGLHYCSPRLCSFDDCKLAGTGNDYIGHLNTTRSKRHCKMWTNIMNKLIDIRNFPDPTLEDAKNFCRNPNKNVVGSWCFTNDSRVPRDLCYIKDCDKPLECTALTSRYKDGTYIFILPSWRKNGLQFWLKGWNPDIYEGLIFSMLSMDKKKQYKLMIGAQDNEKLMLLYQDDKSEVLLVEKTLPHLIPTGKWKGYWLKPGYGKIELGYYGESVTFFEWVSLKEEYSFNPLLINFGTIQQYWIGINFQCNECLTTETSSEDGFKIYPINLWRDETVTSNLLLNLRGTGSAFVNLMWSYDNASSFSKKFALQIISKVPNILVVQYEQNKKQVLASFLVSSAFTINKWSEYVISFTENSLTVHKDKVPLLEWISPFPLLFYWFAVTAEGGTIIWTANCPASDIDGEPRDGNWGKWGPWSCSVSCGKGKGRIERLCDDPPPNIYGNECEGSAVFEGSCNDFPCGKISPYTNNNIRQYLSSQHKSLQVDVSERIILTCNPQAISLITTEVSETNISWTHNGFPYSRTKFHMDENYSLIIHRAQDKHNGIYLCIAYQDPDSIPSKIILEVVSVVVIKPKPKTIRKGKSITLKCNGLALSYAYADLTQTWEINGRVWKDYGLGTLQTFTADKLENISDSHAGVWTCVVFQEDFKFKWTTNWMYIKVKSAPNFWSHLMEDVATAPLFGKLGNERNAMILFYCLISLVGISIALVTILLVKHLK